MPIPATSDLPKPKSWDEFEDIVWEIYTRKWQDSQAQRYGRSGQPQSGIDIYGRQYDSGNYVAIQCKRYQNGKLTFRKIEKEVASAEDFSPKISEYIIATTAYRDAKIQDSVRSLNEKRRAKNRFSVCVVFWEDICSFLTDQSNHDVIKKYYYEWGEVFGSQRFNNVAAHSPVPQIYELAYSEARQKLIAAGWQPKKKHWSHAKSSGLNYGTGLLCWQKGYHEIDTCSGTGYGFCSFEFVDLYGNKLKVITAGMELPDHDIKAGVVRWFIDGDKAS